MKTRSITIELPEKACTKLEQLAEQDHTTLETFVQQRLADLLRFAQAARRRKRDAEPATGQYL